MSYVEIKVEGLDDLARKLANIEPNLATKVLRSAVREAGDVLLIEAVSRCPVRTDAYESEGSNALPPGALKGSLTARVSSQPSTGAVIATVGPSKDTAHVGKWVEYGHALVSHSGKTIGQVPAHPWLRPAVEASTEKVVETVTASISEQLEELTN